jgi:hypothetical protein
VSEEDLPACGREMPEANGREMRGAHLAKADLAGGEVDS